MTKVLQCGKNKIPEPVPVHGFGVGPTKAKAKSAAMDMAHGFANLVAATRAAELKCPTDEGCQPRSLHRGERISSNLKRINC